MSYSLQILAFHRILPEGEDYFIPPMAMSDKTFSTLIRWLARFIKIVDLGDAAKKIRSGRFHGRAAAITFDDGYKDNFDLAKGILKREGIPATFFIAMYPIDKTESHWWDCLYHAARENMPEFSKWLASKSIVAEYPPKIFCRNLVRSLNGMSNSDRIGFLTEFTEQFGRYDGKRLLMNWDEIRQLQKEGFSIGSHSLSHIPLTDLTPEEAKIEIEQSKTALSEKLNSEISGFCYPRGVWNEGIARMVQEAGYDYAVTTIFGSNKTDCDLYGLCRRNMSDYQGIRSYFSIPSYLLELTGVLDPVLTKRR